MTTYHSSATNRTHIRVPELRAWKVELTRGLYTLVDDDVFEQIKDQSWIAHKTNPHTYARKRNPNKSGPVHLNLHREIMNAGKEDQVDHINLDTLDNRKINLRCASRSQNKCNGEKYRRNGGSSSRYKGVTYRKDNGKWRAQIVVGHEHISLGQFENELDAAKAYDQAAGHYFGAFARVNGV